MIIITKIQIRLKSHRYMIEIQLKIIRRINFETKWIEKQRLFNSKRLSCFTLRDQFIMFKELVIFISNARN